MKDLARLYLQLLTEHCVENLEIPAHGDMTVTTKGSREYLLDAVATAPNHVLVAALPSIGCNYNLPKLGMAPGSPTNAKYGALVLEGEFKLGKIDLSRIIIVLDNHNLAMRVTHGSVRSGMMKKLFSYPSSIDPNETGVLNVDPASFGILDRQPEVVVFKCDDASQAILLGLMKQVPDVVKLASYAYSMFPHAQKNFQERYEILPFEMVSFVYPGEIPSPPWKTETEKLDWIESCSVTFLLGYRYSREDEQQLTDRLLSKLNATISGQTREMTKQRFCEIFQALGCDKFQQTAVGNEVIGLVVAVSENGRYDPDVTDANLFDIDSTAPNQKPVAFICSLFKQMRIAYEDFQITAAKVGLLAAEGTNHLNRFLPDRFQKEHENLIAIKSEIQTRKFMGLQLRLPDTHRVTKFSRMAYCGYLNKDATVKMVEIEKREVRKYLTKEDINICESLVRVLQKSAVLNASNLTLTGMKRDVDSLVSLLPPRPQYEMCQELRRYGKASFWFKFEQFVEAQRVAAKAGAEKVARMMAEATRILNVKHKEFASIENLSRRSSLTGRLESTYGRIRDLLEGMEDTLLSEGLNQYRHELRYMASMQSC